MVGLLGPGAGTGVSGEAGGQADHLDVEAALGQGFLGVAGASDVGLVVTDVEYAAGQRGR